MDVSTLSEAQKGEIYKLCTDFKIEPSDPLVGVFISLVGLKEEIKSIVSEPDPLKVEEAIEELKAMNAEVRSTLQGLRDLSLAEARRERLLRIFGFSVLLVSLISFVGLSYFGSLERELGDMGVIVKPNGKNIEILGRQAKDAIRQKDRLVITLGE